MATQPTLRHADLRFKAAQDHRTPARPAPATAQAWLSAQPQIALVARDRGGGYALAAAKALPDAVQVADRWHLMDIASRAFLDAVRKSMRQVRAAIGAATINPSLLTAAERIQYEGYLRREEDNAAVLGLAKEGTAIKEIVRRTGHSRGLVRRILRGQRSDISEQGKARSSCICPTSCAALLDGAVDIATFTDGRLAANDMQPCLAKFTLVMSPEIPPHFEGMHVTLEAETEDGRFTAEPMRRSARQLAPERHP